MKFAHLADCHIGGWRDPKLRDANANSFRLAIRTCLERQVDFVLISGDLFNTAVPAIDSLKMAVKQLRKLKNGKVPVYIIAGSHDFSPSGKTMLDVLEQAGLVINVAKGDELPDGRVQLRFTVDPKTQVKITGMIGKKGGLETGYYHVLAKDNLEQAKGSKVFLFHTALAELKPKGLENMDAMPLSYLPRGFDYYAGGHVHVVDRQSLGDHKNIVYPGPIFPNNFSEVEKLKTGSFVIVDDWNIEHVPLKVHPAVCLTIEADDKSPADVELLVRERAKEEDYDNAIVTVRCRGCLSRGRPADINWNDLIHDFYAKGAYVVLKNTNALTSKDIEVIMVKDASVEDLEDSLVKEHSKQSTLSGDDIALVKTLIRVLSAEKAEGERVSDFESRLGEELDVLLKQ